MMLLNYADGASNIGGGVGGGGAVGDMAALFVAFTTTTSRSHCLSYT